jgi:hypothetical protein
VNKREELGQMNEEMDGDDICEGVQMASEGRQSLSKN